MNKQHWQDWLVAVIGVCLVISNWLLGYVVPEGATAAMSMTVFWNATLTGIAAIVLGVAALASFRIWEEWADMAIGLWLIASPWVLGFTEMRLAMWNVVVCGVVVILSAAWTLYEERETGHA